MNVFTNSHGFKRQSAYLTSKADYNAIWQFIWPDRTYRLEMEGQPIQPDQQGLLKHCQTGVLLGTEFESIVRNDFGVEWAVDCCTHVDMATKRENSKNYFSVQI